MNRTAMTQLSRNNLSYVSLQLCERAVRSTDFWNVSCSNRKGYRLFCDVKPLFSGLGPHAQACSGYCTDTLYTCCWITFRSV